MKNYYALQYQILIFALVIFNLFYTFMELPYITTIYLIDGGLNVRGNIVGHFETIYSFIISSSFILQAVYLTKAIWALGLLLKPTRKLCLLLLVVHACVFEDMGSTNTPETEFLNILYLFLIAVPESKFQLFKSYKKTYWTYNLSQQKLLWIITGLAYSTSGFYKLLTPAWQKGIFIERLLRYEHLARIDFEPFFTIPGMSVLCIVLTYIALFTELLALPLAFNSYTRLIAFILLTGMHIIILLLVDVAQITLGMLVFHIYLFEPHWLKIFKNQKSNFFFTWANKRS